MRVRSTAVYEAGQYLLGGATPTGVCFCKGTSHVHNGERRDPVQPGQWIVLRDGVFEVIDSEAFERLYEVVPEPEAASEGE